MESSARGWYKPFSDRIPSKFRASSEQIPGKGTFLSASNHKSLVISNRGAQIARISPKSLSWEVQTALSNRAVCDFVI